MANEAVKVTEEPKLVIPTKDFVKYIGYASTRIIRYDEWPSAVATKDRPEGDLVWARENGWMVKKSDLSADVLSVLEQDGSFIISEK